MLPIGTVTAKQLTDRHMGVEAMDEVASNRCQEGSGRMTFPDILSDPLIRAVMEADHVDPRVLARELSRIAQMLPARANLDVRAGCCMAC
jgi:hypothetical protein